MLNSLPAVAPTFQIHPLMFIVGMAASVVLAVVSYRIWRHGK